ncbi:MAG TPA: type II secretion system F family protein, partial [Bacillota bacterium]|nr:type II secretion system F family protein [Bacillota bacterium]
MPNFKYEVVDAAGRSSKGIIEAATIADASKMLRADGRFIASLVPDTGSGILSMNIGSPKLKTKDLMIITRQLASLLSAGITIIRSLDMLYQQLESKKAKAVIGSIYEGIQSGKTLSEAFREQEKALPKIMTTMIAAGEESGRLDEIMARLAAHFEKESKLKNKVAAAMVYPVILLIVTMGITIGLMTLVVPRFAVTLGEMGAELPGLTLFVLGISENLVSYWYIHIAVVATVVILVRLFLRSEKGGLWWSRVLLVMPIVGKS